MTDPLATPTDAADAALPAPEETEEVGVGAWQGDRPDEPEDSPEPPEDPA